MQQHSFSDFSYAINKTSAKKGYKEILVCFIYNGTEVLRKLYIREKAGTSYIFEAKKIIDREMKSGVLASYSYKFVKRKEAKNGKPNWKWVAITAGIAAVAIAGMSVGMYFVGKNSVKPTNPDIPVPPDSYSVTFFTSKYDGQDLCQFEGETVAKAGEVYSCKIYSKYDKANRKPEVSFITMGGKQVPDYEYTFSDNILTIESPVYGDIFISTYSEKVTEYKGVPQYRFETSPDNVAYVEDIIPSSSYNADVTKADVTTIDIPSTVVQDNVTYNVKIDAGALNGCSSLKHLSVPFIGLSNEASVGFDHPNSLFGSIFGTAPYRGGTYTYQTYVGSDQQQHTHSFTIPDSLVEVDITGGQLIPDGAFSKCSFIKSITFSENNATIVGESAFLGCANLTSVSLPSTINTISANAFNGCTVIKTVDLTGVTTINENAFYNCIGVSTIFIPTSVETIGKNAFSNVGGGILCGDSNAKAGWDENWTNAETVVLYGYDPDNPESYAKYDSTTKYSFLVTSDTDETTKEGATLIEFRDEEAFRDKQNPIVIPDTVSDGTNTYHVRHLGSKLFMDFIYTSKFKFETTQLISIGNYCFANCVSLTGFEESENVEDHLTSIGSYAFAGDKLFECNETVTTEAAEQALFPKVKKIGNYAFHDCQKIESICLGKVETIGNYAFSRCCYNYPTESGEVIYDPSKSSLKEVGLPHNIETIGEGAFGNARGLTKVTPLYGDAFDGNAFVNIPTYCFSYTNLSAVEIPAITQTIGFGSYAYCTNLSTINFNKASALKSIGDSAFYDCKKLTKVSILNSPELTSLGESGFEQCMGLTEFEVTSQKLTGIPYCCFYEDAALNKLIVNTNETAQSPFTSIGDYAFKGCTLLSTIFNSDSNLPATIKKVGKNAFRDCKSMILTIPYVSGVSSSISMGEAPFAGWTSEYKINELGNEYDDSNAYVRISKNWVASYSQYGTNVLTNITDEKGESWVLTNDSVRPGGFYLTREKYNCAQAVSKTAPTHLHLHLI